MTLNLNHLESDKVKNLVMNLKDEKEPQFDLRRKSNNKLYYFRPKVQTYIHNVHLSRFEPVAIFSYFTNCNDS